MNKIQTTLSAASNTSRTIEINPVLYDCRLCNDSGLVHPEIGEIVEYYSPFEKRKVSVLIDRGNCQSFSVPCESCKPLRDAKAMAMYQSDSRFTDAEKSYRLDAMKTQNAGGGVRVGTTAMVTAGREMLAGTCNMLTIHGSNGNGKTHFLKAMVNEFLLIGTPALYITAFDLIQYVNDAFSKDGGTKNDESALDRIEKMKGIRVLAIDEFSAFKETDWNMSVIESIIDYRWQRALAKESFTLFAMNEKPESLTKRIQSRIKETRLRENGSPVIENNDTDVRGMRKATTTKEENMK